MGFLEPDSRLASFFRSSQQYVYRKGEVILRPEDIPSGMYYIERGFVKSYSLTPNGSENIYIIFQSGDLFPGHWHFIQNEENKLFYEAMTPVVVHRKPREAYEQLITTDISVAGEVERMLRMVSNIFALRIESLEHTDSYARAIVRLLAMAKWFGKQQGQRVVFNVPITHYDFAHTINMSRETASRELEKLQKKKLISEENHIIMISDIEKLKEELEEYYLNK